MVSSSIFQYIKEDNVSERMLENQVKTLKTVVKFCLVAKIFEFFQSIKTTKKQAILKLRIHKNTHLTL